MGYGDALTRGSLAHTRIEACSDSCCITSCPTVLSPVTDVTASFPWPTTTAHGYCDRHVRVMFSRFVLITSTKVIAIFRYFTRSTGLSYTRESYKLPRSDSAQIVQPTTARRTHPMEGSLVYYSPEGCSEAFALSSRLSLALLSSESGSFPSAARTKNGTSSSAAAAAAAAAAASASASASSAA